jgi:hypothetical protein
MNEVAAIMEHLIGVLTKQTSGQNVHQSILKEVFEDKRMIEKARTNMIRRLNDPQDRSRSRSQNLSRKIWAGGRQLAITR